MSPETPLKGLPLAVLDTETTALVPGHIVEIAIVHAEIGDAPPRLAYSTRINPGVPIPEAVSAIHGITDADVADAPTWEQAWPAIRDAIGERTLVAFNAPFDAAFLGEECRRIGAFCPGGREWLCVQVPAKQVDRYESSKRLVDIAARRGIVLDAHGAAGDAIATALVAVGLWRKAAKDCATLGDLLAWQHRTALEQERDFCAYLVRQGARGARPSCPWHTLLGKDLPDWPAPDVVRASWTVERDGRVLPVVEGVGK